MELTLSHSHLPGENVAQLSAAVAIYIVPIVVPLGTHYCWVDKGGVDSKLVQGFYHMTGAAGIEPQTPLSRIKRLKHSHGRFTDTSPESIRVISAGLLPVTGEPYNVTAGFLTGI